MKDDQSPEFAGTPGDLKLSWGRDVPGQLIERWPKDANGEPVTPAFLKKCTQLDMADTMTVNMLEAYGIPCLMRYPHSGEFGKLVLGMSGFGTEIYVPETLLEDAVALTQGDGQPDEIPEGEE